VVRCTFSPPRAWRPAVAARLARTLAHHTTSPVAPPRPRTDSTMLTVGLSVLAVIALLLAAFSIWIARSRRNFNAMLNRAEAALKRAYEGMSEMPVMNARYVYSFPAFTVSFSTMRAAEQAAQSGANARFTQEIQTICANEGTTDRPFDAKLAVTFDYPGRLQGLGEDPKSLGERTRSDA
jgi:hypothetical protein